MTKPEIIAAIDERIIIQHQSIREFEGETNWLVLDTALKMITVLKSNVDFLTTLKSQIQELKTVDND